MTTETTAKPYAHCGTCELDLDTPEDAARHRSETLAAARAVAPPRAPMVSGHSTRIVNPTPEEREASRLRGIVSRAISQATDDFCERMDDEVRAGRITEEQVTAELRMADEFSDAWAEWVTGG